MSFPSHVADKVLVDCGRSCAICHKFCGLKIELHHIVFESDGGPNTLDNCIPLCFDCHGDMRSYDSKHPKGRKYSRGELKAHRDSWYAKVHSSGAVYASSEHLAVDRTTFQALKKAIEDVAIVDVLRNRWVGQPYRRSVMAALEEYLLNARSAEAEFLDVGLETLRAGLNASLTELLEAVSQWTFPTNVDDMNAVQRELKDRDVEQYNTRVDELARRDLAVCDAFDALVRAARRRLAV